MQDKNSLPQKPQSWVTRLNQAILDSADNLPAALVILIAVYIIAEAHNYIALRDFAYHAGTPWALSYLTPVMLGAFILVIYWVLVAYKAKGYNTTVPWLIIWLFVIGSTVLNIMHFGVSPAGVSMSILSPALILFGGYLAKDVVTKQVKESRIIRTVETLNQDAQQAQAELHNIQTELAQATAERDARKAALEQIKAGLEGEIEQLRVQRAAVESAIDSVSVVPENIRQAIQIDALMAAGLSQTEAARLVGIHRNTAGNRLDLCNGSGLRGASK